MASAESFAYYEGSNPSTATPGFSGVNPYGDGNLSTGKSLGDQILRWLGVDDAEQRYQNALTENNRAYEYALLQDARNYETWFDSTAVQRRVNDIKAAGLNPWLALQSGGIGSNGTSSSGVNPGSGSSAKLQASKGNAASSLAMLLLASAKLIALLG